MNRGKGPKRSLLRSQHSVSVKVKHTVDLQRSLSYSLITELANISSLVAVDLVQLLFREVVCILSWSDMDSVQVIVGTVLIFPLVYYSYRVFSFLREARRIAKEVDKLPGEPKHWFYGNLHQVINDYNLS